MAVGPRRPGDAASPPRGTRPVTEPVGARPNPGRVPAGAGRWAREPTVRSPTRAHRIPLRRPRADARAEPDSGTGSFRARAGTGSYPAVPEGPASGTGSHRAPSGTGLVRRGRPPVAGRRSAAPAESDGEHTRALPAVPDDKR